MSNEQMPKLKATEEEEQPKPVGFAREQVNNAQANSEQALQIDEVASREKAQEVLDRLQKNTPEESSTAELMPALGDRIKLTRVETSGDKAVGEVTEVGLLGEIQNGKPIRFASNKGLGGTGAVERIYAEGGALMVKTENSLYKIERRS